MAILPIFIPHGGCPHQCSFCNQRAISGQAAPPLEGAKAQLQQWQTYLQGKGHELAFYGGSFTALDLGLQEQLLQLVEPLYRSGFLSSLRASTRPDAITDKGLQLLKKYHVQTVELGVQSLDEKVLKASQRGHNAACVSGAVRLLREAGLIVGVQLMVGLPEQGFASFKETITKVLALKPDLARIYPVLVIKDTPLEKMYYKGVFVPLSLEEAVTQAAYGYRTMTEAGIKVIRIGLQADGELCAPGNIVAGPFHPAMGELVKSRALRNAIDLALQEIQEQGQTKVVIKHLPALTSQVRGQKNANMLYWQQSFPTLNISLMAVEKLALTGAAGWEVCIG